MAEGPVSAERPPAAVEFAREILARPRGSVHRRLDREGRPSYNAASGRSSTMITGYNTDVRHVETVVHVQTEDKGRSNPFIESVVYVAGRVVATKRSSYAQLLAEGKGDPEIAALMDHQHRTIVAAIRAGRFDGKLQGLKGPAKAAEARREPAQPPKRQLPVSPRGTRPAKCTPRPRMQTGAIPVDALDASLAGTSIDLSPLQGLPPLSAARSLVASMPRHRRYLRHRRNCAEIPELPELDDTDEGPTLDQVILDYLSTEAEHEQLMLAMDGQEEIQPGRVNNLTLRAYSSKSGLPLAGVQVSVKMLSTVADPRTLMVGETDDVGAVEMRLDVPAFARGSAALIISGSSDLGRAEIKQLL